MRYILELLAKLALGAKSDDFAVGLNRKHTDILNSCRRYACNLNLRQQRAFSPKWGFASSALALLVCQSLVASEPIHSKSERPTLPHSPTLTISGDVECDWMHVNAKTPKKKVLATAGSQQMLQRANRQWFGPYGANEFSVQVDLMLDYRAERSWSSVQLEFEDPAGIQHVKRKRHKTKNKNILEGTGKGDNMYLLDAYVGYALMDKPYHKFDIELGRRPMYEMFDSLIEFNSQFDGTLLRYSATQTHFGDFVAKAGAFVIDYTANHFGYVSELDLYGVKGSYWDLKYSIITWDKRGANAFGKKHPLGNRFVVSQWLVNYNLPHKSVAYAAFLHNHTAPKTWRTKGTRAANGAYLGVTFGRVEKKNDWSFDCNYQWVQAQTVPEWDIAGIGRFNPTGTSFYSSTWGGFANYKGFAATLLFGLTDALTLQLQVQQAKPANTRIGGTFRATTVEVTTTYTF